MWDFFGNPRDSEGTEGEKRPWFTPYKEEITSVLMINGRGSIHTVSIREPLTSHAGLAAHPSLLRGTASSSRSWLMWCHQSKGVFHVPAQNQKGQWLTQRLFCARVSGQLDRNKGKCSNKSPPSSLIIQKAKRGIWQWFSNHTGVWQFGICSDFHLSQQHSLPSVGGSFTIPFGSQQGRQI